MQDKTNAPAQIEMQVDELMREIDHAVQHAFNDVAPVKTMAKIRERLHGLLSGKCLHQIQEPAAAVQAAWHAGQDEGRAQAARPVVVPDDMPSTEANTKYGESYGVDWVYEGKTAAPAAVAWSMPAEPTEQMIEVLMAGEDRLRARHGDDLPKQRAKNRYHALLALAATPAAMDVPAEGDPASLLQLADLLESGRHLIHVERKEVANALRTLAATPAAAPVVLPEPDFWVRPGATIHPDRGWQCWSNDGTATGAFHAETVRSLMAGVSAPAAHGRASVTPNGDKWKLVDGDLREAGDGLLTYHADAYREGLADGALLATATGLPAQAVAYIDSEVLTSFLSSSNYRPADGWDCYIRHQENKRDTDVPLYSRHQAQADARDAAFEAVRKKFCKLQRYSFFLDDKGNVRRTADYCGNWVEFEAVHTLFEPGSVDAAIAAAKGEQE